MTTTIRINQRGTLTLPKALRHFIGMDDGGVVVAEASREGIVLRPSTTCPIEMYTDDRVQEFDTVNEKLGRHLKTIRS